MPVVMDRPHCSDVTRDWRLQEGTYRGTLHAWDVHERRQHPVASGSGKRPPQAVQQRSELAFRMARVVEHPNIGRRKRRGDQIVVLSCDDAERADARIT
jgi:hypothetical protein